MQGYIKLWRDIMENSFYHDSDAMHLFTHLILKACHKDNEFMFNGQIVKLKRGQLLTGRKILSAETGISEQSIRTRLEFFRLSKPPMIDILTTNKYSIITICKYNTYQDYNDNGNQPGNQQITSREPTDNQQITTNNNVKNDKNDKECKELNISPEGEKKNVLVKHYESLLEENGIQYIPTKSEYIVFYKHLNKYLSKGAVIEDIKGMITRWFESGTGEWCGYKLANFWGDVGKLQVSKKTKSDIAISNIERTIKEMKEAGEDVKS